nr:DUF4332 domain-containing protein [Candidatus Sigynarchaeota archaeon]
DLFRIPNLSPRMAELLVNADINSVRELSHRDPIATWYKLQELADTSYFIMIKEPSIAEVEEWIYYAKLMTRRIKYGHDIPLINLTPHVTLDLASELQKYKIWTIEDLDDNFALIANLAGRVDMSRREFAELLGLCDLCKVNGVDVLIAKVLDLAGVKSLQQLRVITVDELQARIEKVKTSPVIKENPFLELELARPHLEQIVTAAKEQKITSFLEAMA